MKRRTHRATPPAPPRGGERGRAGSRRHVGSLATRGARGRPRARATRRRHASAPRSTPPRRGAMPMPMPMPPGRRRRFPAGTRRGRKGSSRSGSRSPPPRARRVAARARGSGRRRLWPGSRRTRPPPRARARPRSARSSPRRRRARRGRRGAPNERARVPPRRVREAPRRVGGAGVARPLGKGALARTRAALASVRDRNGGGNRGGGVPRGDGRGCRRGAASFGAGSDDIVGVAIRFARRRDVCDGDAFGDALESLLRDVDDAAGARNER